jgi:hypothetical protein
MAPSCFDLSGLYSCKGSSILLREYGWDRTQLSEYHNCVLQCEWSKAIDAESNVQHPERIGKNVNVKLK